jgi:hypothetical protein
VSVPVMQASGGAPEAAAESGVAPAGVAPEPTAVTAPR